MLCHQISCVGGLKVTLLPQAVQQFQKKDGPKLHLILKLRLVVNCTLSVRFLLEGRDAGGLLLGRTGRHPPPPHKTTTNDHFSGAIVLVFLN